MNTIDKFFIYTLAIGTILLGLGAMRESYHLYQMEREYGQWMLKTMQEESDEDNVRSVTWTPADEHIVPGGKVISVDKR